MTTSELKQQIEKVLGNSIRCLLPSYWWKRLFHQVADRIDEVEQSVDTKADKSYVDEAVGNVKVDITIDSELSDTSNNPVQNKVIKTAIDSVASVFFINKTLGARQFWAAIYGTVSNEYPRGVVMMDDANIEIDGVYAVDDTNFAIEFYYNGGLYKWIFNKSTGDFVSEEVISSSEGVSDLPIYVAVGDGTLSLEQVNANVATYTAISNDLLSRKIPFVEYVSANGSVAYSIYMLYPTSNGVLFYTSDWDNGSPSTLMKWKLNADGATTFVEYVYPDKALSESSTNPIQNKVVTAALNNKVDKVEGKQLSTEDFTTALKTKLEGLSNYDDTELSEAVARLRDDFNSLTQEDISAAIENFNEIISFLDGIEDSESLDSIIASIEQQIANKQDKLVSGTNIKTINGESILGEGNIVVNVDTSNLATKQELNAKQDVISDLETIRSGAALGATALQEHQDISHLATKEEVTNLQNEVIANEEVSAAAFNEINDRINAISENVSGTTVTKEEFESTVEIISQTISDNKSATDTAIEGLETSIGNVDAKFADYATTESLNGAIETINNTIVENEEITATALTDLDARIKEIIARLDVIEGNN